MHGLVTVRLLDPPLHEFLPKSEQEISEIATVIGAEFKEIKSRIDELHEQNPMLGHRGCDLAFLFQRFIKCNVEQFLKLYLNLKK